MAEQPNSAIGSLSGAPPEPASAPPGFYLNDIVDPNRYPATPLYDAAFGDNTSAPPEQWNDLMGQIVVRNVTLPTLTAFLPEPGTATGKAVVVAPGGGYLMASIDKEGWLVAQWLAQNGIAAFVLKYRLEATPRDQAGLLVSLASRFNPQALRTIEGPTLAAQRMAVADAHQAMKVVRTGAGRWDIEPDHIGFIGFSAGAMTGLQLALDDELETRPDFLAVIYGPMSGVATPAKAPPLFAALASDDPLFGKSDFGLIQSWQQAGRPVELHLYEKGGHGFGLGKPGTTSQTWKAAFLAWLSQQP